MTNEKIFSDVKNFAHIFLPINWLICFVISLILFIISKEIAFGYILGALTSFLTFGLLMKNTQSSLLPEKKSVVTKILGGYVTRMIISGAILVVAFYDARFNFYSTIAGLTVLKIVLVIFVLVRYKFFKDKEEIIDDSAV
ncbi:MAG: ATP synthase subunit I [bacterium]